MKVIFQFVENWIYMNNLRKEKSVEVMKEIFRSQNLVKTHF